MLCVLFCSCRISAHSVLLVVAGCLGPCTSHACAAEASAFLLELRELADPLDLDFPEDKELADGTPNRLGERMKNMNKASAACSQLIEVTAGC